jgi:hypothetical protein
LALSVSLKLFSLFLIPYILWRGYRRAFIWSLGFLTLFWLVLPTLFFGGQGAMDVYGSWLDQLHYVSGRPLDVEHPIVVSLHTCAQWFANHYGARFNWIEIAFRVAWIGLAVAGAALSWRRTDARSPFGVMADASLLILAPIALSPYLEPYHPVAIAIPAMLLIDAASDRRQPANIRRLALGCFLVVGLLTAVPTPWAIQGLIINLRLLAATGAVIVIAHLRRQHGKESHHAQETAQGQLRPVLISGRFEIQPPAARSFPVRRRHGRKRKTQNKSGPGGDFGRPLRPRRR